MISFPNAKINLGLNVLSKREDGFHDLETLIYPIGLCDVLEILISKTGETTLKNTGIEINSISEGFNPSNNSCGVLNATGINQNLVIQIYRLLKKDFDLPPVYIHLHKAIPAGAGLGGGSSDCAYTMKMFNKLINLGLSNEQQQEYVSQLGSDCAFFVANKPAISSGRGEILKQIDISLSGFYIHIIKPDIHINTGLAYSWVKPSKPAASLKELIANPIKDWKNLLVNDFELPVFQKYPELKNIRQMLYNSGAVFAAMSGSGSALFGLFENNPTLFNLPERYFQWRGLL